jgi:ABC-2 type transport system permease protein
MLNLMKQSLRRTAWIARITFLEAIRQRFFAFLILLSAALVVSSVSFRFLDFGHGELKFVADFGFGGIFFFGSILTLVMTAQLFFAEIENRTALTLLAKPVSRWEFLVGKFTGVWAVLGIFIFTLSFILGLVMWGRHQELVGLAEVAGRVPPDLSVSGVAAYALLQWLRLGVIAAMVLAVSSVARSFLFAIVVGAMAVLAGQLQWIAQEALLKDKDLGVVHQAFLWLITRVIPNLQQFNIGDALALDVSSVANGAVWAASLSGCIYMIVLLILAGLGFRRREI